MSARFDVVALDADDTLWINEERYRDGEELLGRLLGGRFDAATISAHVLETETRNVRIFGYGVKSFTLSLMEVAVALGDGDVGGPAIRSLLDHGKWMLEGEIELYDGIPDTLERLARDHRLMLITKGDSFEQSHRVGRSGVTHLFRDIEIVGTKTPASYRALLERYDIDPGRFLMVGNSLKSDVLPVVEIGGHAIHVPREITWAHENVDESELDRSRFTTLANLMELPDWLAEAGSTG